MIGGKRQGEVGSVSPSVLDYELTRGYWCTPTETKRTDLRGTCEPLTKEGISTFS